VNFDGTFGPAGQIYWTGTNCTGTPLLNDGQEGLTPFTGLPTFVKAVVFSAAANKLYVPTPNQTGVESLLAISVPGSGYTWFESPTCIGGERSTESGWTLTDVTSALGWSTSVSMVAGVNQLHVAGPIQLP
jgi:hypothetical protein